MAFQQNDIAISSIWEMSGKFKMSLLRVHHSGNVIINHVILIKLGKQTVLSDIEKWPNRPIKTLHIKWSVRCYYWANRMICHLNFLPHRPICRVQTACSISPESISKVLSGQIKLKQKGLCFIKGSSTWYHFLSRKFFVNSQVLVRILCWYSPLVQLSWLQ